MDIIISANKTVINLMHTNDISRTECDYVKSPFVYVHKKSDGTALLYNTLYNSLARLSEKEYKQFLECYVDKSELTDKIIENRFWLPATINEKQRYIDFAHKYTLDFERPLSITITTTLKCNARCTYCYESGVNQSDILPNSVEKIIEFIKLKSKLNKVIINLFGGEPLLNVPFIRTFFERLQTEKIEFSSYLITNGSLITQKLLDDFAKWNIKNVQISLDGTSEEYERKKRYLDSETGNFKKVLDNIELLSHHNIFVHIRLNISRENQNDILNLISELDKRFDDFENVVYYPAFLSGTKNPLSEEEKINFVLRLFRTVKNPQKLTVGTKLYSAPKMHSCMIQDPFSFTIDVNGNIFFCEHLVGCSDKAVGNIFSEKDFMDTRIVTPNLQKKCSDCVFLPKCFGGCYSNRETGDDPCMIEKYIISAYMDLL